MAVKVMQRQSDHVDRTSISNMVVRPPDPQNCCYSSLSSLSRLVWRVCHLLLETDTPCMTYDEDFSTEARCSCLETALIEHGYKDRVQACKPSPA